MFQQTREDRLLQQLFRIHVSEAEQGHVILSKDVTRRFRAAVPRAGARVRVRCAAFRFPYGIEKKPRRVNCTLFTDDLKIAGFLFLLVVRQVLENFSELDVLWAPVMPVDSFADLGFGGEQGGDSQAGSKLQFIKRDDVVRVGNCDEKHVVFTADRE